MKSANFEGTSVKESLEKIALTHIQFERIHPFKDGNGRVGRMILNQQLINNGLLLLHLVLKENIGRHSGFMIEIKIHPVLCIL